MAQVDGDVILSKTYMARVCFKHAGKKFKSFDELVPKDLNWTVEETVSLVKAGRIMPFDTSLDAEVFYEIPYLQRKNQLGISAAEMRDIISTGRLDEASQGLFESDLTAASKLFSTHCYNQLGVKVATNDDTISVIPFDAHTGKEEIILPELVSPYEPLKKEESSESSESSDENP